MARLSKEKEATLRAVKRQALAQAAQAAQSVQAASGAGSAADERAVQSGASGGASAAPGASGASGASHITPSAVGLGVDIVEIDRMERVIERTPRFLARVFSEGERAYAWKRARPAIHYALFFAAKEAVLKALGTGFAGMQYTDVEVIHDEQGKPLPLLHGHALEIANEQGIVDMQLSLSHTHQMGVASAVAIKDTDRPIKDERRDPHAELARQFKEMRSLLDDMDTRLSQLPVQQANEGS
jgi:holo-[acyl-carrier protein] synthase